MQHQRKTKKRYSEAFRRQRLEEINLGLSIKEVADKSNVSLGTLRNWVKLVNQEQHKAPGFVKQDPRGPAPSEVAPTQDPEQKNLPLVTLRRQAMPAVSPALMADLAAYRRQIGALELEAAAARREAEAQKAVAQELRDDIKKLRTTITVLSQIVASAG